MHSDDRFTSEHSTHSRTEVKEATIGPWTFTPVNDPDLDDNTRHKDELLSPAFGESTRAEYLFRSTYPRNHVGLRKGAAEVFVKGVIAHEGCPLLELVSWHRAMRRSTEDKVTATGDMS